MKENEISTTTILSLRLYAAKLKWNSETILPFYLYVDLYLL